MSESKELTLPERAAVALGSSAYEVELRDMVKASKSIVAIKNGDGRDECHAAMMRLADARIAIKKAGKEARDDANKFSKAVIVEEDRLVEISQPEETRLRTLRDAWDEIIAKEKQAKIDAEIARVEEIQQQISDIRSKPIFYSNSSSEAIAKAIQALSFLEIDDEFEEFKDEAEIVSQASVESLRTLLYAAKAKEDAAAKLLADQVKVERQMAELAAAQATLKRQQDEIDAQRVAIEREKAEKEKTETPAPIVALVEQQMTLESAFDEPEPPQPSEIIGVLVKHFNEDEDVVRSWLALTNW